MPRDPHPCAPPPAASHGGRPALDVASLDVAVVGAGAAGLAAAWLLGRVHRVTIYEAADRPGGHAHTVVVPAGGDTIPVDVGFIVYNELNYPELTALFRYLQVPSRPAGMSFAVSIDRGQLEYAGGRGLRGLAAQPENLLRPGFRRMLWDILRFYREAPALLTDPDPAASTQGLGDWLTREGYSRTFADHHLLPMAAAIWSCSSAQARRYPAQALVRFFDAHGLLRLTRRPRWRSVAGGSRVYVERLLADTCARLRTGHPVSSVRRTSGGVRVEASGEVAVHDQVVLATPADVALALLADADQHERQVLGAFAYSGNAALLHGDRRLMPKRRAAWASWNVLQPAGDGMAPPCVSYWMTHLQGLDSRTPLFVTLNPPPGFEAQNVYGRFAFRHPLYDAAALAAQPALAGLQGRRRTWFCGSYFGSGFHEDALASGLAVADALAGVRPPWAAAAGTRPVATARLEQDR